MRSRKFIPAVTAVISLLALVPSSALAHKHRSPNGRCAIDINVAPRQIVAGDPVVVFGRLRCANPANAAGREVRLFHHLTALSGSGYSYVQSTTTEAHGFYEFSRADGVVETNRSWYVTGHGARSAAKRIKVAAQVSLNGPPEGQLQTGFPNRVTFSGTVSPEDVGARVVLQRQNALTGNEWRHIDSGVVGANGAFTIVHTFVVPGDANIRVLVRSQRRNVPSTSDVLAYSISQAQNAELTIQASTDPIAYGEAVTISGKLASGVNQPVTLLARTVHQSGFARVAQVSTNATGEYSFPAQTPLNSTFYRVQAAGGTCDSNVAPAEPGPACPSLARRLSSAVLYEGVRDVLTAQASPTTIQAGQSVTFSGAVSPDHTGHVIYLERQDANGAGFHVIQVAYIEPGSIYSIAHRLYDPGAKVLRVYIPGGPENQGVASQPFMIQVNPTLASMLTPEASENTTLPSEGQS